MEEPSAADCDNLVKILENNPNLKKSFQGILYQMSCTAAGTVVGGACFGPLGAAAGSIGGAVYGYVTVSDYESMIVVLRGMSDENKRQLVARIKQLIGSIAVEVVTAYLNMQTNCDKLAKLLQDFLREKADTN